MTAPTQRHYLELEQHSVDLVALHRFIERRARQFKLTDRCDSEDILHDVILRWRKRVEAGEYIADLESWFRGAAYNRIREISRDFRKASSFEPSILENMVAVEDDSVDSIAIDHLREAMQSLSPEQRELLEMRFYRGMDWESIARVLTTQGQRVSKEALRKRGQRALEELRKQVLEKVCS
jgi:RNA polymerase sigma factor (sigma-70 family)